MTNERQHGGMIRGAPRSSRQGHPDPAVPVAAGGSVRLPRARCAAALLGLVAAAWAGGAAAGVHFTGVNMAGGEFRSGRIPGRIDKDYHYPRAKEFAPFADAGMNAVRIPVLWRRLQPDAYGAIDPVALRMLDKSVAALAPMAALVILDIHDYARLDGHPLSEPALRGALPDLWGKLAAHYRDRPGLAFGLMNEPHDIDAQAWRGIAEASVRAIRATGAGNLVLVPGVDWTGAHNWLHANARAFAGFRDPGGRFLFEMHQYLDADSSGTHADCPNPDGAGARLAAATRWLREQRQRGFLAEFGATANPACLRALDGLLDRMDRDGDVWAGWTYWAGGAWWGKYPLSVQPDAQGERAQMAVLRRHVAAR